MATDRLLLCRPQGGLNDMLCQIEKACRYAERFDRTVVVETDRQGAETFKDRFSRYFVSRQSRLVLDADGLRDRFDDLDTVPGGLRGRVNRYVAAYRAGEGNLTDAETGLPLSFDFDRDYAEALLVHHAFGGGRASLGALARMRVHDAIGDVLVRRLAAIGPSYVGVHIRNTDYRTSYGAAIAALAPDIAGPVFVASDNRQAIADCRDVLGAARVHSFAELPLEAGRPSHHLKTAEGAYGINADAILDLLTLALADRVYGFKLEQNRQGVTYSGFTLLAMDLNTSKAVLSGLIARSDPVLDHRLGPAGGSILAGAPSPTARSGGV